MKVNLDVNKLLTQISSVFSKIFNLFKGIKPHKRVNIKKLSEDEKAILKKFYIEKYNEYTDVSKSISEANNGLHIINKLVQRNIIQYMSEFERMMAHDGFGVCYKLNPKAIIKLNKKAKSEIK